MPAAIEITELRFGWDNRTPLLHITALQIDARERVFLYGPSGSGKSTLLNLAGGLLQPQSGVIRLLGQELGGLSAAARDRFRAEHIGFLFQQFNLIPYLDAVDNISLGLRFAPKRAQRVSGDPDAEARRLMTALELDVERLAGVPARCLSIGQQQRVAAARALIGAPELLIADEPTSSLDAENQQRFIELLFDQCEQQHSTLLFVSHDQRLATAFDRTLSLAELNGTPAIAEAPC